MRKTIILLLIIILLSYSVSAIEPHSAEIYIGIVKEVNGVEYLTLELDHRSVFGVSLLGIKAPYTKQFNINDSKYHLEFLRYKKMILNKYVDIEYNLVIGKSVVYHNSILLNCYLLKRGLAVLDKKTAGLYLDDFQECVNIAKKQKTGIWSLVK